jgi:hypothetical protein
MKKPLTAACLALLFTMLSIQAAEQATEERRDAVAQRGARGMPFSWEQTTHIFSKADKGGVQQVLAKDLAHREHIALIRAHLLKISQAFLQGDFSDPARIHGDEMPGLAELRRAQPGQLKIRYQELPEGAQIDYTTDDPPLIEAIHPWFDTQLRDHAHHAVPGHSPHRRQATQ